MSTNLNMDALLTAMRLIESPFCPTRVPVTVPRFWRERLWSWPWRPWVATKTTMRMGGYLIGPHQLVMHPLVTQAIRASLLVQSEPYNE